METIPWEVGKQTRARHFQINISILFCVREVLNGANRLRHIKWGGGS